MLLGISRGDGGRDLAQFTAVGGLSLGQSVLLRSQLRRAGFERRNGLRAGLLVCGTLLSLFGDFVDARR